MSTIRSANPSDNSATVPGFLSGIRHNPLVDLVLLAVRPQAVPANSATVEWIKRHPLLALFSLAYGLTWLGAIPYLANPAAATQRNFGLSNIFVALFFIGGCLWAAVIVATATGGIPGRHALYRRFLRWRVNVVWYLVALFFPAFIALAGIALNVALGGAVSPMPILTVPPGSWALVVLINIGAYMVGNFEEFTWRGVALPRLQTQHSALSAALILGVVQAVWHLPYFFVPHSIEQQLGPLLFLAWNIGLSIVITWVFNNAKESLLLAQLFHAANDGWGGLLASPNDLRPLFLSIGVLCVVAGLLVVIFGARRLSRQSETERALSIIGGL